MLPCTPHRTMLHWCQIVHLDPLNAKRSSPHCILLWAMCKCMVSMATHGRFENGGPIYAYKVTYISVATYLRPLNLKPN